MKINAELLVRLRTERSWSQDELAIASGLNLRTVQRIEKDGSASLLSKKALAAALAIDPHDLDAEKKIMRACLVCRSTEIHQIKAGFSLSSDDLLPGLGSAFLAAKIRPTICLSCGNVQLFASEEAREKARTSNTGRPRATQRASRRTAARPALKLDPIRSRAGRRAIRSRDLTPPRDRPAITRRRGR